MPIICEPAELAALSKCFACMTQTEIEAVKTYLLSVLAGETGTPDEILDKAKCWECIDRSTAINLQNYLLCQAVDKCAGG